MRYRALFFTVVILGAWAAAWKTGVTERFTTESIRALTAGRGVWGIAAFVTIFSGGQLLRIPSTVFVAAAVAIYGRTFGIAVALLGAFVSAVVSFAAVRAFAGQVLVGVQRPLVQRLLSHIDRKPVLTVALLRLVFQTAPPLNYVLPMTAIRWREHLVGSLLGLPAPIILTGVFIDWVLHHAL